MLPAVLAAILVGGSLQRVTGMGFALVSGPFLVLMLGAGQGVLMLNVLGAMSAGLILVRVWRAVEWRRFAVLATASVCTTVPAAWLLRDASGPALEVTVGLVIIAGMTVALLANRMRTERPLWRSGNPWPAVAAGALSGAGSVTAGVGGPPMAAYAVLDRWDPRRFAATLQPFFIVNATGSAGAKLALTDATLPPLEPWAWAVIVAAVFLASVIGDVLARRVPRAAVRRVLVVIAYLGGLATLLRGLGVLPG